MFPPGSERRRLALPTNLDFRGRTGLYRDELDSHRDERRFVGKAEEAAKMAGVSALPGFATK
jgi:hypothetical protein